MAQALLTIESDKYYSRVISNYSLTYIALSCSFSMYRKNSIKNILDLISSLKFVLFVNARKSAATHLKTPRPNTHHNTHKTAHINHPVARTKNNEQHKFFSGSGWWRRSSTGRRSNRQKSKRNTTTNNERDESTSGTPIINNIKNITEPENTMELGSYIDRIIRKDDTLTNIIIRPTCLIACLDYEPNKSDENNDSLDGLILERSGSREWFCNLGIMFGRLTNLT